MQPAKIITFLVLTFWSSCNAQHPHKASIGFSDPTLNLDVKKALIFAVNELDKSSRTVWKERIVEVISHKQTFRDKDIIYDISAKLAPSTCSKIQWNCIPNPLHGQGIQRTAVKYTVPFQAPLLHFFLLPFEMRMIEITGYIPVGAKETCFMLQNGPDSLNTTSVPFRLCLEFPEESQSSVKMMHYWKTWKTDGFVNTTNWLQSGSNFSIKVNFQQDTALISMRSNRVQNYAFEYQIPIESTHLSIRGDFSIDDVKIASIEEENTHERICTIKVLKLLYGLKWVTDWECEDFSPSGSPSSSLLPYDDEDDDKP